MTGLRGKKKEAVRHRIIQAAAGLFTSRGIDATTMEEIAARADVSVGTVYNYFGTKNALLLAGVGEDVDLMLERGRSVLARPGTNPVKASQRLLGVYLESFVAWEPVLLREVLAASFGRTGGVAMTAELARMDQRLIEQLAALLVGFQERGRLRPDVDPVEGTFLLFSAMVTQLFMYLALEDVDEHLLRSQLNRQIDLAFSGIAALPSVQKEA